MKSCALGLLEETVIEKDTDFEYTQFSALLRWELLKFRADPV